MDPDCAGSDDYNETGLCLDGLDNDGDGLTDCQDSECMNVDECFSACLEEENIDLGSTIGEDVLSLLEHPGAELDPDTMDDDSRGTCFSVEWWCEHCIHLDSTGNRMLSRNGYWNLLQV